MFYMGKKETYSNFQVLLYVETQTVRFLALVVLKAR